MPKIKVVSSVAFDAICFFEQLAIDYDNHNFTFLSEQKTFRAKIENLTAGKLKNGLMGMSGLCSVISSKAINTEFEHYTLYDLAEFFKNPENIREGLETGTIWATDKRSPEEWAEKYLDYINILNEVGFDKLWEFDLLPIIQEEINKGQERCKTLNMDAAFADIQKLKQSEPIEDVKIYISLMSYPIAFKIHGNSYVNCVYADVDVGIICHELMHGVTNNELESLYLDYINSDQYLKEQHEKLIKEMRSGNEEEFVLAAEYYLRMKHNGEDKKELLQQARNRYGGDCVPTSISLFDLLSQEAHTPNGYAQWLTGVFKNKKLPHGEIENHLNIIAPKNLCLQ